MKISQSKWDELTNDILDQAHGFSVDVRDDYSGRGMYGKTCVGFVTDSPIKFAMTLASVLTGWERDYDESGEDYDFPVWYDLTVATDNMARDAIVYFPNLQIED